MKRNLGKYVKRTENPISYLLNKGKKSRYVMMNKGIKACINAQGNEPFFGVMKKYYWTKKLSDQLGERLAAKHRKVQQQEATPCKQ